MYDDSNVLEKLTPAEVSALADLNSRLREMPKLDKLFWTDSQKRAVETYEVQRKRPAPTPAPALEPTIVRPALVTEQAAVPEPTTTPDTPRKNVTDADAARAALEYHRTDTG